MEAKEAIDHSNTKVLIIGVSNFPEDNTISSIPNVLANIKLLKSSLLNTDLIGIPEGNIMLSINGTKKQIERELQSLAESTRHEKFTLIVYYSGHGILSSKDFQLYLTTHDTSRKYLESDGIDIDSFKNHINWSLAARKIVILDCCHSGAFIKPMGSGASALRGNFKEIEGTYVITSAAEDEHALFAVKSPDTPTFFTGKLIEILTEGLDNEHEFCTLRDIYEKIEFDFKKERLPQPQQSNINNADQFIFFKNKKWKPADEIAWEKALTLNSKWAYFNFTRQFPSSIHTEYALGVITELEDAEHWMKVLKRGTLSAFNDYLYKYPEGKYIHEAEQKIYDLRQFEEQQEIKWKEEQAVEAERLAALQKQEEEAKKKREQAREAERIAALQKQQEESKRKKVQEAEAERIAALQKQREELRKKEEELEAGRIAASQRELEEARRKKEQEVEAERIAALQKQREEAKRKKEEQLETLRIAALQKQQEEAKRKKDQEDEKNRKPKEFTVVEAPFAPASHLKELIVLGAIIFLLIFIVLFIIYKNTN